MDEGKTNITEEMRNAFDETVAIEINYRNGGRRVTNLEEALSAMWLASPVPSMDKRIKTAGHTPVAWLSDHGKELLKMASLANPMLAIVQATEDAEYSTPLYAHPPSNSHEERENPEWLKQVLADDVVGDPFKPSKTTRLPRRSEYEELVEALRAARKTMRNVFSAISTNQIGDKDASGQLRDGMSKIDAALSNLESSTVTSKVEGRS